MIKSTHIIFLLLAVVAVGVSTFAQAQIERGPQSGLSSPMEGIGHGEDFVPGFSAGEKGKSSPPLPLGIPFPEPKSEVKLPFEGVYRKKGQARGKLEDPCPSSERLARKRGAEDVSVFMKKTPLGTWNLFMHQFRQQYSFCPSFIKRAYLKAARDSLMPKSNRIFTR